MHPVVTITVCEDGSINLRRWRATNVLEKKIGPHCTHAANLDDRWNPEEATLLQIVSSLRSSHPGSPLDAYRIAPEFP
jgi:ATP-dependent helicase YprA (DUF1998 family)